MPLTVTDLHATLEDDRHLGFGYACVDDVLPLGTKRRERLDNAIVAVANELGLDYEPLFHWSNSKHGRWLADAVYGRDSAPTRATVRDLLNEETIAASMEGVEEEEDEATPYPEAPAPISNDERMMAEFQRGVERVASEYDSPALDRINYLLSDPEWGVGMLEDIAEIVQATGRQEIPGAVWMRH